MNVIIVGSNKKEIGKTTVSMMTASELAKTGNKVLMMDLSSGKIKMSEYLKVYEDIIYDIADVFMDICTLEQAVIELSENLYLLPSPKVSGKIDKINNESFLELLKNAEDYDYVIIDADKLTHGYIDFSIVQNVISINNNDFSSIKEINTQRLISSKSLNFIVVINKYNIKSTKKESTMNIKDIKKLTQTADIISIEENNKYFNFNEDMHLDNIPSEITDIIKLLK